MVSIPTSLFGVIGFLILAGFLFAEFEGANPNSFISKVTTSTNKDISRIQAIQSTNQTTDWLSGISNIATVIGDYFDIFLNYILMPFVMLVNVVLELTGLPLDLAPIVSVFVFVGVISGIAIFIRRG